MGISDFYAFLKAEYPGYLSRVKVEDLRGFTIPFDLSLFLFKFKALENPDRNMLDSFFYFIHGFVNHGIKLVAVKDGKAPKEKEHTQMKRRMKREEIQNRLGHLMNAFTLMEQKSTDLEMIKEELKEANLKLEINSVFDLPTMEQLTTKIKSLETQSIMVSDKEKQGVYELMEAMGVPLVEASGEAEQMCAYLVKTERANACLSDDSDVVACGCPYVLREYDPKEQTIGILSLAKLLKRMGITYEELLDFCVLCGNDYNDRIPKFGPKSIFKVIQKFGCIEDIPDRFTLPRVKMVGFHHKVVNLPTVDDDTTISYKRVREIFTQNHEEVDQELLEPRACDPVRVREVLKKYHSRIHDKQVSYYLTTLEPKSD